MKSVPKIKSQWHRDREERKQWEETILKQQHREIHIWNERVENSEECSTMELEFEGDEGQMRSKRKLNP